MRFIEGVKDAVRRAVKLKAMMDKIEKWLAPYTTDYGDVERVEIHLKDGRVVRARGGKFQFVEEIKVGNVSVPPTISITDIKGELEIHDPNSKGDGAGTVSREASERKATA